MLCTAMVAGSPNRDRAMGTATAHTQWDAHVLASRLKSEEALLNARDGSLLSWEYVTEYTEGGYYVAVYDELGLFLGYL